ncbi:MAG TPA: PadR family transcriptional regulator [Gemmatimonadota bacterium]|nr:PadR family transcriptional regulator [Gemmatimonadota bacterium]
MSRELKRGTIELVLLTLLKDRERYGYEIVSAIEEWSGGRLAVRDGTLYPVLYRLEEAGFIEPRWETPERGVPRKYYRITDAGKKELDRLAREWREFAAGLDAILDRKGGA